jgi:hypothetical protein
MNKKAPTPEAIRAAKKHPNGWLYEIKAEYQGKADVPLEGIISAWKVDERGHIIGDFIPKEDFNKPK